MYPEAKKVTWDDIGIDVRKILIMIFEKYVVREL
jgi:hypothetical protein